MTASFAAGVFVGWISLAGAVVFALGWAAKRLDYADHAVPPKQPAGVRDPETQLLWNESGVVIGRTWTA